jgi:hypothetical protein
MIPSPPPPPPAIPVAHSALLAIDATRNGDALELHIRHAANQIPIDGQNVIVTVDGKNQSVTPEPEGTFALSTKDWAGDGERQLDITVAHDGIREILTGKITIPKVGSTATDLLHDHQQMAWWVLNVGVILVAVMAFSRRSSKKAAKEAAEEDE